MQAIVGTGEVSVRSAITGTGTYVPMTFHTNGSERMRIDTSGNVGIGTATPLSNSVTIERPLGSGNLALNSTLTPSTTSRLFLIGAGTATDTNKARISFDSDVYGWTAGVSTPTRIYFSTTPNGSTTAATRMTIDNAGNVGIGVTPSAWTTFTALQISSRSSLASEGTVTDLNLNVFYDGAYKYIASATASQYRQQSGTHQWYTAPSGTAGAAITFTEAMRIDSSGNVGIGTSGPGYKLDVQSASGDCVIRAKGTAGTVAGIFRADGFGSGSYPGFQLAQSNTSYWTIGQRGDTNLHIYRESGSGNVTIDSGSIVNGSGRPILNQTGSILQVVQGTQGSTVTSTSSTPIDSNLSASITPSSTSSRIMVTISQPFQAYTTSSGRDETGYFWYLYRNATLLNSGRYWFSLTSLGNNKTMYGTVNYTYVDSPATTSSVTYKTQFNAYDTLQAAIANVYSSTIVLQEIAG